MLVPVVDFALIVAPIAWRHPQIYAVVTMVTLGTILLTGGVRYRARLHLSVLDELPSILTRMLTATVAVASVVFYLHQRDAVVTFFETACQATALVLVGRFVTTRLIAYGRQSRIIEHHTVLVGGGPLAVELAQILKSHKSYGLKVDGFVDDGDHFPAEEYLPRPGRLRQLELVVTATGAELCLLQTAPLRNGN